MMSEIVEFHTKLQTDACKWILSLNNNATLEYRLPNGRIADIISYRHQQLLIIIEVKTTLTPYLVEQSLDKYKEYCDHLIIAAPETEAAQLLKSVNVLDIHNKLWTCGYLWLTDNHAQYVPCREPRRMNATVRRYIIGQLKDLAWGSDKSAQERR